MAVTHESSFPLPSSRKQVGREPQQTAQSRRRVKLRCFSVSPVHRTQALSGLGSPRGADLVTHSGGQHK